MNRITFFLAVVFAASLSNAIEMGVPIQLRLKDPDGIYPNDNNATFNVQILTPSNGCVLREENFSSVKVVGGTISFVLGSGQRAGFDPNLSLTAVYDNTAVKNNLSCVDANNNVVNSGQSYNPAAADTRILRIRATITGATVVADFTQRSVPYAIQAESVGGKIAADLLSQNSTTSLNQSNLETLLLNATRFAKLQNLAINGAADTATTANQANTALTATNFSGGLTGDVTGTQSATVVTAIRGVGVAQSTPALGQVLAYNGSEYAPMTVSVSASVSSVNGKTGAVVLSASDISGVLTDSTNFSGDVTGQASAMVVSSIGGKSASALSSADTLALRDSNGNLSATGLTATGASLKNIFIFDDANANRVEMRAPNSFANYTLVLPTTDGNSGEVLQTDGSGNLSWTMGSVPVTSAAITSALGYTPAANNDSRLTGALQQTSFNTYVASANCTAGQTMYWSSVSSSFLCQNISVQIPAVTSSTITTALGYTPANSTANLSDLTNVATARTNLGLGLLATANSIDLANTTGTLTAARLPAFSGDATSTVGSNSLRVEKIQGIPVDSATPTVGQVMVYDGSKWTAKTNSDSANTSKKNSDQSFSSTTVSNVTSLSFEATSGVTYKFKFNVLFSSAATKTGVKLGLTAPAGTLAATAYIPSSGDGVNSITLGHITSSGDLVTGTGVQAASTSYYGYVEGLFVATSTGTVQLTMGSEVNSSAITAKAGSFVEYKLIQ